MLKTRLRSIDPSTGATLINREFPVGQGFDVHLAREGTSLWPLNGEGLARRIDVSSGAVESTETVRAGVLHNGIAAAPGRVAVASDGKRTVPILSALRELLARHQRQHGAGELVFSRPGGDWPYSDTAVNQRAGRLWEEAGLKRITPHECRHTFAGMAIAAGVNAKTLCDCMGHASIKTTFDRYGHLMPGGLDVMASLTNEVVLPMPEDEQVELPTSA